MNETKIIYVPTLHRQLAPRNMPAGVLFIDPGLPKGATASDEQNLTLNELPFSPKEAALMLRELLAIGADFGTNGNLKLVAASEWLEKEKQNPLSSAETGVLNSFVQDGSIDPAKLTSASQLDQAISTMAQLHAARINAHKTLLLAWDLEEKILEIASLEQRFANVSISLQEALGEAQPQQYASDKKQVTEAAENFLAAVLSNMSENIPLDGVKNDALPDYSLPIPPWRAVLEAAAAFLPESALLLTSNSDMAATLREAGMLQPLPEDLAALGQNWPPELLEGLLWAHLPLWRMLGYTALPADRPWLNATFDLLVARHSEP